MQGVLSAYSQEELFAYRRIEPPEMETPDVLPDVLCAFVQCRLRNLPLPLLQMPLGIPFGTGGVYEVPTSAPES